MTKDVRELLFKHHDPYRGFPRSAWEADLQGWGGHDEFFRQVIKRVRPELIIEVGSWKGKSAIKMSEILDDVTQEELEHDVIPPCLGTQVVCVDTWLGATEFIDKPNGDPKRGLRKTNGYPTVFYTFLANVLEHGAEQRIVPFPQTSTNAARFLKKNGVQADLIYIDGSHEADDVMSDLWSYSEILSPEGVMIGDDYCEYWHGVKEAIDYFMHESGLPLKLELAHHENPNGEAPSDYWVLSKTGDVLK